MSQKDIIGTVNCEYTIIEAVTIGAVTIVMGYAPSFTHSKFVTWAANHRKIGEDGPSFYWGHYFASYYEARTDFYKRIYEEAQYDAKQRTDMVPAEVFSMYEEACAKKKS